MTTSARWAVSGIVGLTLLIATRPGRPDDAQPATDPFEAVDLEFRGLYAAGRAEVLRGLDPVIVVEMDQLILLRGGKRTAVDAIPKVYHRLKAVSHVPLALYAGLAPFGDRPLDEGRREKLRNFRERIGAAANALNEAGFNDEQRERSGRLLRRAGEVLDAVLARGRCEKAELLSLCREVGPIVLANASDAARAQIDAYHRCVSAWRAEIPAEEWAKLRVLVLGLQMPRKHNVAVQYFAKLLGGAGESRRLVYAEELGGEAQGLNLLATHKLDSEVAVAFFDDPERMEIDLLGNAAAVYLDTLDLNP